jgi:dGTP triphosphohydrolase
MDFHDYLKEVGSLEGRYIQGAQRSFEKNDAEFVDGESVHDYYAAQFRSLEKSQRLLHRTPIQVERDRIVHSEGMRRLTEKYHVLYNGQQRIVRNFTTHTMRMAQVARSICRGLSLNGDFAETLALGAKIGAVPFVHAAKHAISDWIARKVTELDDEAAKYEFNIDRNPSQLAINFENLKIPSWIQSLKTKAVRDRLLETMPWAAGDEASPAYCAGAQGYWQLCLNPFSLQSASAKFTPETACGIWRHSLTANDAEAFLHRCRVEGAKKHRHEIKEEHLTYEAIVVRYADDITWIIENLNDAHAAALLNARPGGVFTELLAHLGDDGGPPSLLSVLGPGDTGGMYTYFINDFVTTSEPSIRKAASSHREAGRTALRDVGLSLEARDVLRKMEKFLHERVFEEPRVKNRFEMLKIVSRACMDLLYKEEGLFEKFIKRRAIMGRWATSERLEKAEGIVKDKVARIQLAVTLFADMGDQEIYDFVGIQAL